MNRRDFLSSAALSTGALMLSFSAAGAQLSITKAGAGESSGAALGDFLRINSDGEVLFHFTKHEMGQGVATAMAQMLCEELDADWNRMRIEFPVVDLPRSMLRRDREPVTSGNHGIVRGRPWERDHARSHPHRRPGRSCPARAAPRATPAWPYDCWKQ